MSAGLKSRDEYTGPVRSMENNLERKRSSRRKQISNAATEKIPSCQAPQNLKVERKCEAAYPFAKPYINQNIRFGKQIDDEHVVQLKPSGSFQKQQLKPKLERQDELVRHMSNLPAYLQQVQKQKNVQEKALNFGVLDWKRLEKWKYDEHMPARGQRKASSRSNSLSVPNMKPSLSKASLHRKQFSADLHLRSSHEDRLPDSVQQFPASSNGNSSSVANVTHSLSKASLHRKQSSAELHLRSSNEERSPDSVQRFPGKIKRIQDSQTTSFRTVSGQQIDFSEKVKSSSTNYPETDTKKSLRIKVDQKAAATMQEEILSSSQIKQTSLCSVPITDQCRKKKTAKGDEIYPCPKYSADEPQPIVLLVPKHPPRRSSAQNSQLAEKRTSYVVGLDQDNQKRFSNCLSSQELHLAEPHQNDPPITARQCKVKCREGENSDNDCSVSVETSKRMDLDDAEQQAVKGRHSSPIRRFSFSLGKLSRSFSFKESSTVPHLSSTYGASKSGPVSSEARAGIDDYYPDKAYAGEKRRSSPFRRLLDPILKPKGAHSARMSQPSDKSSISVCSEPISTNKSVQDQILQASSFQAMLQLNVKNGLPYLKFVVDNSSDILAAAVKKPPSSRKADYSLIYTFYSVREIKKKTGGWISHGSKEKSCNIGYNIIAEMKSSYCISDLFRESVLYTVDIRKGDKGQPEVFPKEEIAAVIVKDPAGKLDDGEPKEVNKCKPEWSVQCSLGDICHRGEKENLNNTIVILPGGVHSSPNGGRPSSLIDRWKSGGLCDCGGWDIGCKLRVLTDKNKESNCSTSDMNSSDLERIDLFSQDTDRRSQPSFSLIPLKDGLYSVKFSASIPSLEAFSMSVAAITSKKLPDVLDMDFLPEAKLYAEPMKQAENFKNRGTIQVQLPAKYVPSPPPSPVGRI